jgi:ABC-type sugar transport system ATPase subunit
MATPFIQFEGITKRFGGVTALDDVSFTIDRGQCHALMGENGAGKSTLGKILAGIHRADEGRILLDGKPLDIRTPADAIRAGIGMVHQELAFCPELSVAENLCMGQYPTRLGLLDRSAMRRKTRALLERSAPAGSTWTARCGPFRPRRSSSCRSRRRSDWTRACWCSTSRRAPFPNPKRSSCSR